MVGVSLTAATLTVKVLDADLLPSDTVTVTFALPLAFAKGVKVTCLLLPLPVTCKPLWLITEVLLDVAVTDSEPLDVSISFTLNVAEPDVSSLIDLLPILVMVGVSLTAATLTVKVLDADLLPSDTVTVIFALPFALALGAKVTCRELPVPVV